jgi:CspA family cold shock protein
MFPILSMAEGIIKRVIDRGFGFISTGEEKEMFFHMSSLEGVQWDDLREGQKVTFEVGEGPKGPRAEQVRLA